MSLQKLVSIGIGAFVGMYVEEMLKEVIPNE